MVGTRRATIPESEAFRTRHEVPRVKKETRDETSTTWLVGCGPEDTGDGHQLLFKTQNNFFRENITMDNSLREKRHQHDGSSCKKLKVKNKYAYKALLYSWWRISVTGILRSTFYESQLTTLKKSLTKNSDFTSFLIYFFSTMWGG